MQHTDYSQSEKIINSSNFGRFQGFLNIDTTNASLMMEWYKRVFGFEFRSEYYQEKTAVPLKFYFAETPVNNLWKITNINGIVLHPAYNDDQTFISPGAYLGFRWKEYNGVKREPMYKYQYHIKNFPALLSRLQQTGLVPENRSYDLDDLLIYQKHVSEFRLIDPRDNILTLWDINGSYIMNKITKKRKPLKG